MVTVHRIHIFTATLLLCLSSLLQAATLTATLDRSQLAIDETLRLSLRLDQRSVSGHPDLALLEPYFEVLGRNKSTQIRSINGQTEAWTQWDFTLAPKVAGRILIPAVEFGGAQSQPLQVEVKEASASSGASGDYFLELALDRNQAYPGQQVIASLRLHTSVRLGNLEIQPFAVDGADVIELAQKQYQKQINGRSFLVYELNYALFPHQPGTLAIDRQRLQAVKNPSRSLFDTRSSQPVRLNSGAVELEVLPLPANADARHWLPASTLKLSQTLSEPTDNLGKGTSTNNSRYRVGEPITRTLLIEAEGLQSSQLPALQLPPPEGFRQYDEPAQLDQQTPSQGLFSSRTESYALVPTQAGPLTLPAVELPWWDSVNNKLQRATLPEVVIEVAPSATHPSTKPSATSATSLQSPAVVQADPPPTSDSLPRWWLLSQLFWALLSLVLATLWWKARRQTIAKGDNLKPDTTDAGVNEEQAFDQLVQCCRLDDRRQIRQALHLWLNSLPIVPSDPLLKEQIDALDRALYQSATAAESAPAFDPAKLIDRVRQVRAHRSKAGSSDSKLAPLYPS